MHRRDFHYELPQGLIASRPLPERSASRLLCLDGATGRHDDRTFRELPELLDPGDLLVFNDTRVIPARLFAAKATGGRVEVLIERVLDGMRAQVHLRSSKPNRSGTVLFFEDGVEAEIQGRSGELFLLAFNRPVLEVATQQGHMPLPPYIQRPDDAADRERYQTIYARNAGAVAAPTAGLHFDERLFDRLEQAGIRSTFVTLHVGAGTFQPVRVDDIRDHSLHAEYADVGAAACAEIASARARGARVIAVGTTAVRSLEAAASGGALQPFRGDTALFITPGYRFRVVDRLLTNFHLPESTLLMLVCAFAGHAHTMAAYRHAVAQRYRFYSYGDAMLVDPDPEALCDKLNR